MAADLATLALRVLILFFLIPAVWAKMTSPRQFSRTLPAWRILPPRMVPVATVLVIVLELVIVLSVASGYGLPVGALLGAVLFGAFALAAASVLARGIATSCGCFSLDLPERVSQVTVVRSAALAISCFCLAVLAFPAFVPASAWQMAPLLLLLAPVLRSFRLLATMRELPNGQREVRR